MDTGPDGLAARRSGALDGLRGLAALLVVASHLDNAGMGLTPGLSLAGTGKYGVFLFFVLSSYLLTAQWLDAPAAELRRPATWARYALRRTLRIYPLFLVVVACGWLFASSGLVIPLSSGEVLAHLALLQGKDVLWSIPVEFKYYFALPVVALALRGCPPRLLAPATLAALILAAVLWPASAYAVNGIALGPYLPLFLAGAAAAAFVRHCPARHASRIGYLSTLSLAGVVALTPDLARIAGLPPDPARWHTAYTLLALLWTPVVVACALGAGPARLFTLRPLRWLGRVSFSLYLWHMSALLAVGQHLGPTPLAGWLALAIALVLAGLSERFIERPMNALAHRPRLSASRAPSIRITAGRSASDPSCKTQQAHRNIRIR